MKEQNTISQKEINCFTTKINQLVCAALNQKTPTGYNSIEGKNNKNIKQL